MADIIDTYIKKIDSKDYSMKFNKFINDKHSLIKKIIFKLKIKIEVLRIRFDLLYCYLNLGKFISKYYNEEKIKDFSYKEDYFLLNNKINLKKRYIKKLKIKSKISAL